MSFVFFDTEPTSCGHIFSYFLTADTPDEVEHIYRYILRKCKDSRSRLDKERYVKTLRFYDDYEYLTDNYIVETRCPAENGLMFRYSNEKRQKPRPTKGEVTVSYQKNPIRIDDYDFTCLHERASNIPTAPHLIEITPRSPKDFGGLPRVAKMLSENEKAKQINFSSKVHPYAPYCHSTPAPYDNYYEQHMKNLYSEMLDDINKISFGNNTQGNNEDYRLTEISESPIQEDYYFNENPSIIVEDVYE